MIIETTRVKKIREDRKRSCVNCGHHDGVHFRCGYDGSYIPYWDTWDYWCKHWKKYKYEVTE